MDNVRRVITQGMTVAGKPSLVFPRERPRTFAEFLSVLHQLSALGLPAPDITYFQSRLLRFLVTSPLRRGREIAYESSYDFFVGRDRHRHRAVHLLTELRPAAARNAESTGGFRSELG